MGSRNCVPVLPGLLNLIRFCARSGEFVVGGISDRKQEIKRRRHRRQKLAKWKLKLKKATASEKMVIAHKLRGLTSGAETIIQSWGLQEVDR
jgi:hypothetical protein